MYMCLYGCAHVCVCMYVYIYIYIYIYIFIYLFIYLPLGTFTQVSSILLLWISLVTCNSDHGCRYYRCLKEKYNPRRVPIIYTRISSLEIRTPGLGCRMNIVASVIRHWTRA